jgi:hypothetical protein
MAQREARQLNPYGRAGYFRIAGDTPMILFQVEPFGSLILASRSNEEVRE